MEWYEVVRYSKILLKNHQFYPTAPAFCAPIGVTPFEFPPKIFRTGKLDTMHMFHCPVYVCDPSFSHFGKTVTKVWTRKTQNGSRKHDHTNFSRYLDLLSSTM